MRVNVRTVRTCHSSVSARSSGRGVRSVRAGDYSYGEEIKGKKVLFVFLLPPQIDRLLHERNLLGLLEIALFQL